MRHLIGAFTIVACLITASHGATAATLENRNVEGWLIGAYSDDKTGQFTHCGTAVSYRSGILLMFSVSKDFSWSMGFANSSWRLTPGTSFDLIYAIDAGPKLSARGIVISPTAVHVPLVDNRTLFESFRRGYQLSVFAAGQVFSFNLNNSSKALAATLECTQRYVARSQGRLLTQAAPSTPAVDSSDGHRAEANALVANVLSAAGIHKFRILPPDEIPSQLISYHAVWGTADGLFGTVQIVGPQLAANVEQLAAVLMASDAQSCKGVFASGRYPTQQQSGTARLRTSCSGTTKPVDLDYTIAPRQKGGFYVLAVVSLDGKPEFVREAGARLHDAALRNFAPR